MHEGDTLYPIAGKGEANKAIPMLGGKFFTFQGYGTTPLISIYGADRLIKALRLEANTLDCGLLINDDDESFSFQALPRLAQIAPGFGLALTEVDGEGVADLYIAQNFFGPRSRTGRMGDGLSLLRLGRFRDGLLRFDPLWPDRSGLIVPGDAKNLSVCDLNNDSRPDFVVGVNNDDVMAFVNQATSAARFLKIQLRGRAENPTGVESRVSVHLDDGTVQTAEVSAGGAYLSQSSSA